MLVFNEGDLQLIVHSSSKVRKFDDHAHGLTHCMKAVDFVIEEDDRILLVEFKDPGNPHADPANSQQFIDAFTAGEKDGDLVRKFRDSFVYLWAEEKDDKSFYYFVIVTLIEEAYLVAATDRLKSKLPIYGPASGAWKRKIAHGCGVFNLENWNKKFPKYQVKRSGS